MKVLVMDTEGCCGLDLASRADRRGHEVLYWHPSKGVGPVGKGIVAVIPEWEPKMDWAELIIVVGNSKYGNALAPYFGKGYPIFGSNEQGAKLELDREFGQRMLERAGVPVVPYHTVDDLDMAISLVKRTSKAYAIKPWGGEADKAMTCVARNWEEAVFMLSKWKAAGLKGHLMLQERVEGCEMGISAFFGPHGFSRPLEESFEHKKLMNDELGCNTGEMGTVIRHVTKSKLFDRVLAPMEDYLHEYNYVGDCSINCIIDDSGEAWPLEFTMRLGWPDFCIRQPLIKRDPVEWMAGLVHGEDTLEISEEIAVGVLLAHGDFPEKNSDPSWEGVPIDGVMDLKHTGLQEMQRGKALGLPGQRYLTAGNYLMVMTGTGGTVKQAAKRAYNLAWEIKGPTNLMFRTDIGDRLEEDLPKLQKNGYAKGMEY